ncbi:MAG: lysylphosphatidylglycerol synthase domain-containing protein [Candidatus Pedobacter colombiensis]|uniref:Lysylphosphatidylglycerol synthase domain-containing protein n=1 Tax=Candidatus Pedobacter colombiensis TaxID=3121371 RepID=A0AAJ5W8E2_9SPHI|nr:lysylphosphatidylglycerol synthase domain-containing protein [Pedobacter sp.]WEK18944.1 MAG: lysylphosphatidylglycerol synthase domain-containing protein [Pedobacter sp.]
MHRVKAKILTSNYKKVLSYILKGVIVIFAFGFVYKKLSSNENLKEFKNLLKQVPQQEIIMVIGAVCLLMLVNWGLEGLKWRRLIARVESITIWRAIESVFCGLTWAVFTPNRIGEYGGRVFFLSPKRRIIGVVAMAVGNIGQMVLTNVFGAIAVCVFIYRFEPIDYRLFYALVILSSMFCAFFIIFYFNIKWLNGILLSMRFTRKYKKFYNILARYSKKELLYILLFCLARYIVFSTQYFILFFWLIPEIHYLDILMMVSILFFVQSTLPSLDLFDIGVRSVTASYFFSYITGHQVAVIACTASIWLINIIIPAILGSYFVFKLNFFGSTQRN